jgi:FdhD protein
MRFCGDTACSGPIGVSALEPDAAPGEQGCDPSNVHDPYNIVDVDLAPGVDPPLWSLDRTTYTTSACGVCGKSSIEAVRANAHWSVQDDPLLVSPETLYTLPRQLREHQKIFDKTGGLHAAGIFDAVGNLLCLREDVGRHNAVDKAIGWALREDRLPLRGHMLAVSGRASFELVQKAAAAGIPLLAAVSAPSSLAVELAQAAGMTLAGFVRGQTANVYAGAERISRLPRT